MGRSETTLARGRRVATLARDQRALHLPGAGLRQDILIAASARELGATIVTFNTADFALIGRHMDITFVEPWPRQPAA